MEIVDNDANPEFKWLKKKGVGGKNKEVQFYESFIYDGVKYALYDSVYMYKEGLQEPYVGKLTKVWERRGSTKHVKVHWFFRPEEISIWLGNTKTHANEIFIASGEGHGLANVNPLESIAGPCNVVCISKDGRNPQPSDEEIKAADFLFHRTFNVQSCTILDKMEDKVGGLEVNFVFNRKDNELTTSIPKSAPAPDKMEEIPNTTIASEAPHLLTSVPNKLADDAKGDSPDKDIPNMLKRNLTSSGSNETNDRPTKKIKPDEKQPPKGVESLKGGGTSGTNLEMAKTNKASNSDIKVSIAPADKVEIKERNKTPTEADKVQSRPFKKQKSDIKKPHMENEVELEDARDSGKSIEESKSKLEGKLPTGVSNLKASGTSGTTKEKLNQKDGKVLSKATEALEGKMLKANDYCSLKIPDTNKKPGNNKNGKEKSDIKKSLMEKEVELEDARDSGKSIEESKSKLEEKLPTAVSNLKASGTSGTTKEKLNQNDGKVLSKAKEALEGKVLKAKDDCSLKIPDNNKKPGNSKNGSNGKDVVASSALSKGKIKSGPALANEKGEQSGEKKKKLTLNNSFKVPALPNDRNKKTPYQEFVCGPKPNAEKSGWFRRLPWDERLKNAYDQGTAILLHNVDPDYTSAEVEDIIWHALNENCEAKIVQRTAVSSPHYGQAIILLKTKEAAKKILVKLDEGCLMLSNGRPLVATACPPISTKKNSSFFGHLALDKIRVQSQREDEAVSTSHFSQPNTIEYDMAMDWCLLQTRSKKWWEKIHKLQGLELKKLESTRVQK